MDNNYKFFRNKECEYFPCHEVENNEKFNCLFCYCPLYFLKQCGGNGKFVNGIKDCSSCLIPHSENGYEYIVGKIREVNKIKRK
ncbi:cysteine-rich small domain-containing protein [Clostridium frigoris]|uniref:Cysteine-rich small domain-containing protein n=1 Tax=Clostridium frigoris TaxID=205327 RepID=A0ABS6BQR4_9CLOT|nr:cysteine-rich small domain-containing protein [Clostridium frigoris]MBU3159276.1 cysteine-rich small domain-containing protein [Clostridium frigoris]